MCETEVTDLKVAFGVYHHILRLEIAVHDALGMDSFQAGDELLHCRHRLTQRHSPALPAIIEVAAGQIFHHEKMAAIENHVLVERDYIGMLYTRGGTRLALKTFEEARILTEVLLDLFKRHDAIER